MDVTRTALAERLAGSSDRFREVADQLAERSEGVRELAEHLTHAPEGLHDLADRLADRSDGLRQLADQAFHIDLGDHVRMPAIAWPAAPTTIPVGAIGRLRAASSVRLRLRMEQLFPGRRGLSRRGLAGIIALVGVALMLIVGATGAALVQRRRARRAQRRAERQAARNGAARRGTGRGAVGSRRPGAPLVAVPIGSPAPGIEPTGTEAGQPAPTPAAEAALPADAPPGSPGAQADVPAGHVTQTESPAVRPEAAVPSESSPDAADEADATAMAASDGLRAIRGLGSVTAERLGEMGITSCRQVAAWTPEDVRAVAEHIRVSPERIEREDWVGQARRLVGELETAKPQAG